jgi:hypothetical protein
MNRNLLLVALLLATGVVLADDVPEAKPVSCANAAQAQTETRAKQTEEDAKKKEEDAKLLSGMSVLGNQEAPKALVIVPWKSSVIGDSLGISTVLDDSRQPIDKEVFMRALSYYEVRSNTKRHDGAPAGGRDTAEAEKSNAAQPATAAHRR